MGDAPAAAEARPEPEYRIDDLARLAGTTVRNVRAYQDRGLLPPPRKDGRIGLYSHAHLARLRLIGQMLERGYSLANTRELIGAWQTGQDVADLLGLEAALVAPWSDETPTTMTPDEVAELYGGTLDVDGVAGAIALGILEPRGEVLQVNKPTLLRAGAELAAAGIPLPAILELARRLHADIDRVAEGFVELVSTYVFDPVADPIPPDDVPRLADIVRRLRPLAREAADAELADAMERHTRDRLRQRLGRMLDGLEQHHTEAS